MTAPPAPHPLAFEHVPVMQVFINQQAHTLPDGATLAEAVAAVQANGPFAAAVNLRFVPRTQYDHTPLAEGDQIEIIAPVTGG